MANFNLYLSRRSRPTRDPAPTLWGLEVGRGNRVFWWRFSKKPGRPKTPSRPSLRPASCRKLFAGTPCKKGASYTVRRYHAQGVVHATRAHHASNSCYYNYCCALRSTSRPGDKTPMQSAHFVDTCIYLHLEPENVTYGK